jgi:hypothetical protein
MGNADLAFSVRYGQSYSPDFHTQLWTKESKMVGIFGGERDTTDAATRPDTSAPVPGFAPGADDGDIVIA